jgi:hypothetical protein
MKKTAEQRFWMKVDRRADDGCWSWTGALDRTGYGRFYNGDTVVAAHRFAYELLVGPIPAGFDADHMCHNTDRSCPGGHCVHRRCCNPAHVSPCSRADNLARSHSVAAAREAYWTNQRAKTHCPRGHPYDEANTFVNAKGQRSCRECRRILQAERYRELMAAGGPEPQSPRTHCHRGHELTEENTMVGKNSGKRKCRICDNANQRARYHLYVNVEA